MMNHIPVITIDGPSASGKGTVAQRVANTLGFHYLDSGALYRLVALAGLQHDIDWQDGSALGDLVPHLNVHFDGEQIFLNNHEVSAQVRSEQMSQGASQVAVHPQVRKALVSWQHRLRQLPGLVADGRDMGTVIFPDAPLKVFLTASVEARAERRYKQLIEKGFPANMDDLLQDLRERDARDTQRAVAPLKPAEGAHLLDTSNLGIEPAVKQVLDWYQSLPSR